MRVHRREFLKAGTIGGAGLLAACDKPDTQQQQPVAGAAGYDFKMNIRDGYAYVFRNNYKNLIVGAIDAHGKPHPIVLTLDRGRVVGTPQLKPTGDRKWNFSGLHAELELGAGASPLRVPDETWPDPIKCPASNEWNNLAWLPPAKKLYPGAQLATGWPGKLSARLAINQGTLEVGPSDGPGIFQFKDETGQEVWKQPLSDVTTLKQRIATGNVVFKFYPLGNQLPDPRRDPDHTLEIESDNGILLEITNGLPAGPPYEVGQAIGHFGRYRGLLDVAGDKNVLPHFYPCETGTGACPGDFCPYARFEA